MVYDHMIKSYKSGQVTDIREFDLKFNSWLWDIVHKFIKLEQLESPIDVGTSSGESFWLKRGYYNVRRVGFSSAIYQNKHVFGKYWQKPIYIKVSDIEASNFVFCIDQINNLPTKDRVTQTLSNLMDYSKKFIFLSCWGMDINVPDKPIIRKRFYWNLDEYIPDFISRGFHLLAKITYTDAINVLYVFRK